MTTVTGDLGETGEERFRNGVRRYLQVVVVFHVALLALRSALIPYLLPGQPIFGPAFGIHAGLLGILGLAWWVAPRLPTGTEDDRIRADLGLTAALVALPVGILGGLWEPSRTGAGFAASLLNLLLVIRSALVPTTARRTATVSILAALVAVVAFEAASELAPPGSGLEGRRIVRIAIGLAFGVAISIYVSSIVHGLRDEVDRARRFGRFVIEGELGRGGMGVVYRAQHGLLQRPTAVKVLPAASISEESLGRFERESRATAQLAHPNTIAVYDFGRADDGSFYYAMELVDGVNLHEVVRRTGPMPPARVVHVLHQVLGSLAEAHRRGLVHRDIKPGNVLLAEPGGEPDVVKVVDFGLAKEAASTEGLTQVGQVLGTPLYMAPETLAGAERATAASDVYGVAGTAYYMLTGRHPIEARSKKELLGKLAAGQRPTPSERLGQPIPAGLEALVMRALDRDPDQRPQDAAAFRRELDGLDDVEPWTRADALTWWATHGEHVRRFTRSGAR